MANLHSSNKNINTHCFTGRSYSLCTFDNRMIAIESKQIIDCNIRFYPYLNVLFLLNIYQFPIQYKFFDVNLEWQY